VIGVQGQIGIQRAIVPDMLDFVAGALQPGSARAGLENRQDKALPRTRAVVRRV
jgi:hypothetical protein